MGGTGGQLLTARPVTSPDSARATEPRMEATLRLRLGARFGSGAGERERERGPLGAVDETAVLTRAAVAASLNGVEEEDGAAKVTAEAAVETAEPAVPALPMTLEMPCAMDSSSSASAESCAESRRRASTRDMASSGEGRGHWGARDGKPPGPAAATQTAMVCQSQGTEHQTGTDTGEHTGTAHERPGTGDQRRRKAPGGAKCPVPGRPGGQSRASRCASVASCVARSQAKCSNGPVEDNFGRGNVAFARDGFAERAQNGQRVGVRSPVGAPNDWGVGDVLAKESSQVRAVTLQLGRHPGLRAVSASLQSVRRTDGHVERRVGVAQGRGENISRSQIGAWDEARNLHLGGCLRWE